MEASISIKFYYLINGVSIRVVLFCYVFGIFNLGLAQFTVKDNNGAISIFENEQAVLSFQVAAKSIDGNYERANYIHPLHDIDGTVLTQDFPEDHKHHRGIFWAWHQILLQGHKIADSWDCNDFAYEVQKANIIKPNDSSIQLLTETEWTSPNLLNYQKKRIPFVRESMELIIYAVKENTRRIDISISLLGLIEGIAIGGSEDIKGYGGFSFRMPMPKDLAFIANGKKIMPQNETIQAGNTMNFTASFNGKNKRSIQITSNSKTSTENWILRQKGSMQM